MTDKDEAAKKRYEEAAERVRILTALASSKTATERRLLEAAVEQAVLDEQQALGQLVDPAENGSLTDREKRQRH